LTSGGKEVYESMGMMAEIADPGPTGERGGVKQDAAAARKRHLEALR
jgi:hypothetical protein